MSVVSGVGCSRKMTARIAELEDQAEQARIRAAKFEKDRTKLQIEIRDLSVELEAVNTTAASLSLSLSLCLRLLVIFWLNLKTLVRVCKAFKNSCMFQCS